MRKLLYVDVPFQGLQGGDKNRSNFIWDTIKSSFDADLLLIRGKEYQETAVPEHGGYDQIFYLETSAHQIYQPEAIYSFDAEQKRKFRQIVDSKRYEVIIFRFLSTYHLAAIAGKALPDCKIVIDVDMLFSRISELSWSQDKSLKNRYHLLEMTKLKAFELLAFRKDFYYCFTNNYERDLAIRRYKLKPGNAFIFPNMMPSISEVEEAVEPKEKYILFFGTLNSVANQDAFIHLASDIYPRISKKMQDKDIYLYIAGKNPSSIHKQYGGGRIKVLGAVDDMAALIRGALFVVLPLRIASGTRTRILEAALWSKAVITSTIGAEGFEFGPDEIYIKDKPEAFAACILDLIQRPADALAVGKALALRSRSLYAPEVVAKNFMNLLDDKPEPSEQELPSRKLKLAIVTNRFYPEVGGAETNIYYQARLLAENYDVTIICPKRIKKSKLEQIDGFRVLRLFDVYNFPAKYPNLKAKTLCPELLIHILAGEYDVVQCFPAINYNNMLAFTAAKLKGIPYVMCFFDFIDYASVIRSEGKIDPNVLTTVKPSKMQRLLLKGMDYSFAIADKEIAFIRKFNTRVEYSPVPILLDEYEQDVPNPRARLGLTDQDFIFLCLGRVSYIKGQDIALQAFAKALTQIPNGKLVFVGRTDYEQEFFETMQAFITQNAMQDRVFFTGMVEREEVLGWLRYSDIHVIPVRFMNSGAVVVESWISDTPVLQSDVVDPNLVVDDYNGYLFPSEDVNACASKMVQAYLKKERLVLFSERGKALVKTKYTYDYLIDLYGKVYRKLTSR